jgi:hypothetical protein
MPLNAWLNGASYEEIVDKPAKGLGLCLEAYDVALNAGQRFS